MRNMMGVILRVEGLVALIVALYFYDFYDFDWGYFAWLFLTPDLFMLGYLINKKIGAIAYNSIHNYVAGMILLVAGHYFNSQLVISFGLIVMAHIGMDRMLGFGLKYETDFKDTHLQRV